ncbi:hypothetical protein SAMN05421504_101863 [Amycolatopsis xylanica]|uniref:Uncharacterized protein n=1 Tax=Amycolatopsis xylanica TaxID=589385 RepID=A0A1H2UE88_9PSEU|nr:hypothetical protein [Amycolatopsis xylanica]SDW54482.1 hypothetical protein SAMN05421504_101863 [Amycolatopsis xylanica]
MTMTDVESTVDLLGTPLTPDETELLDLHRRLTDLASRDLAPTAATAVAGALTQLTLAVNALALTY